MRTSRAPAGASLPELIAALLALSILAAVTAAFFRVQTRVAAVIAARAEVLDAARTASALIERELRFLAPEDLIVRPESVALRAFRGAAVVCDAAPAGAVVRYAGIRDPDPTKDSLVVVDSTRRVAPLTGFSNAASASCVPLPSESVLALQSTAPLPVGTVVAVFERGAYALGTGSLRYRRGAGGRQPLTAAAFDDAASRFDDDAPSAATGAAARLRLAPLSAPAPVGLALPSSMRIARPNADTLELRP